MKSKNLKPIAQIILTPIIDVVMILLLFFMIEYSKTSPKINAQKVDIPYSQTALKLLKEKKTIEIVVDKNGIIFIQNNKILSKDLSLYLKNSKTKGIEKVIIRGDKKSPYEKIIYIIDQVKNSGIKKVLLLTKKKV